MNNYLVITKDSMKAKVVTRQEAIELHRKNLLLSYRKIS
jgi:hypothetical protein